MRISGISSSSAPSCSKEEPNRSAASGPRADGLRRFLEQELGMEVVCFARREELSDQEDFYRELRGSEARIAAGMP